MAKMKAWKVWKGILLAVMFLLCVQMIPRNVCAEDTISVTFRLTGCTRSEGQISLLDRPREPATGYLGAEYVTWIPTKTYQMPAGSTVYDLFMKATADAELKSVGAESNYVETIYAPVVCGGYALSEFTNGKYSGWMYTVNGKHPDVGLKAYFLSDKDTVIWHYINDSACEQEDGWTQVEGTEQFHNKWLEAPDEAPKKPQDTPQTEQPAQTENPAQTEQPAQTENPVQTEKPQDIPQTEQTETPENAKPAVKKVTLNAAQKKLAVGKSVRLIAKLFPAGAVGKVQWTSSNKKVASVNGSGLVRAKNPGTARITAKLSNGKKAVCKVTVKPPAAKKVKLNQTKVTLKKGKTIKLKATVTPAGAQTTLRWSSSDGKVAKVDAKGKVTAMKKGKATITVKTGNGKKVVCRITVK